MKNSSNTNTLVGVAPQRSPQCALLAQNDDSHPGCILGSLTQQTMPDGLVEDQLRQVTYVNQTIISTGSSAQALCEAVCRDIWYNRDQRMGGAYPLGNNCTNGSVTSDMDATYLGALYRVNNLDDVRRNNATSFSPCVCGESNAHTYLDPAGGELGTQYAHCTNGVKDCTETDVDCGGGDCKGCAVGQHCVVATTDCAANQPCTVPKNIPIGSNAPVSYPQFGACGHQSLDASLCSDGTKDGLETDVDCGGPTCQALCVPGKSCIVDGDCTANAAVSAPTSSFGISAARSGYCTISGSTGTCATPSSNPKYCGANRIACFYQGEICCSGACASSCTN